MRRRSKHHIGRLRIRAAAIIAKSFPEWDVRPEDISCAQGEYRCNKTHDVYSWTLFSRTKTGLRIVLDCWDTLTEFVKQAAKNGCEVDDRDREIYARRAPAK